MKSYSEQSRVVVQPPAFPGSAHTKSNNLFNRDEVCSVSSDPSLYGSVCSEIDVVNNSGADNTGLNGYRFDAMGVDVEGYKTNGGVGVKIRLEDNLNPVSRLFFAASTLICAPPSLDQPVGAALSATPAPSKGPNQA